MIMSDPAGGMSADQAGDSSSLKRKRSPSLTSQPPATPAAARTPGAHTPQAPVTKVLKPALSINYLARSNKDDLPLTNKEDSLPNIIQLLNQYSNVLDRHESLASNLGARPLGPILIKRFERCFDSPPKVVASHHKTGSNVDESAYTITWLEVIEFARSHPSQFTLSTFSEGRRVCQFYLPQKQLRVQITEEDFIFINSGRCQELIPPLPIWEDEEKEVSTCDVLESKLRELTNIADMVAARTRQLCHRLKGRKAAILERRLEGGSGTPAKAISQQMMSMTPTTPGAQRSLSEDTNKAAAASRTDLLKHFESLPQNQSVRHETPISARKASDSHSVAINGTASQRHETPVTPAASRVSISGSASKHNFSRPLAANLESTQPFRLLCQAHMESLQRGQRVLPPCDRCRRLKMDCVKNLTSCAGCTKKHARCHWRDVSRDEVSTLDHLIDEVPQVDSESPDLHSVVDSDDDEEDDPLEDIEALAAQVREEQSHLTPVRQPGAAESRPVKGSAQRNIVASSSTSTPPPSGPSRLPAGTPSQPSPIRSFPAPSDPFSDTIAVTRPSSLGGFRAVTYATSSTASHEGHVLNPRSPPATTSSAKHVA